MRAAVLLVAGLVLTGCPSSPAEVSDAGSGDRDAPIAPGTDAPMIPSVDASAPASCNGPERTGEATYYDADGTGNCSFPAASDFVVAMNDPDWEGSGVCGTCVAIDGPSGSVVARVVDRCPECPTGNLDLSMAAFAEIAEPALGRVDITWREVPCPLSGGVTIAVDPGANPYYLSVVVRNVRHRVVSVERRLAGGSYAPMARQTWNTWVESPVSGAPVDAMHLRITDSHGGVVEADVAVTPSLEVEADQLPVCAG